MYAAETWTLRKKGEKNRSSWNVGSEKDGRSFWEDRLRNEKVLMRIEDKITMLETIRKKLNWLGHNMHEKKLSDDECN